MQIDVGFGNAIEPPANDVEYPTLLDAPAPNIRAHPPEVVVAEKLHTLVVLGERTSRMKVSIPQSGVSITIEADQSHRGS